MLQMVNGYICMSGCDVEAARRGADPRNPTRDPVKQEMLDRADPAKAAKENRRPATDGFQGSARQNEAGQGALAQGIGQVLDIRV